MNHDTFEDFLWILEYQKTTSHHPRLQFPNLGQRCFSPVPWCVPCVLNCVRVICSTRGWNKARASSFPVPSTDYQSLHLKYLSDPALILLHNVFVFKQKRFCIPSPFPPSASSVGIHRRLVGGRLGLSWDQLYCTMCWGSTALHKCQMYTLYSCTLQCIVYRSRKMGLSIHGWNLISSFVHSSHTQCFVAILIWVHHL